MSLWILPGEAGPRRGEKSSPHSHSVLLFLPRFTGSCMLLAVSSPLFFFDGFQDHSFGSGSCSCRFASCRFACVACRFACAWLRKRHAHIHVTCTQSRCEQNAGCASPTRTELPVGLLSPPNACSHFLQPPRSTEPAKKCTYSCLRLERDQRQQSQPAILYAPSLTLSHPMPVRLAAGFPWFRSRVCQSYRYHCRYA